MIKVATSIIWPARSAPHRTSPAPRRGEHHRPHESQRTLAGRRPEQGAQQEVGGDRRAHHDQEHRQTEDQLLPVLLEELSGEGRPRERRRLDRSRPPHSLVAPSTGRRRLGSNPRQSLDAQSASGYSAPSATRPRSTAASSGGPRTTPGPRRAGPFRCRANAAIVRASTWLGRRTRISRQSGDRLGIAVVVHGDPRLIELFGHLAVLLDLFGLPAPHLLTLRLQTEESVELLPELRESLQGLGADRDGPFVLLDLPAQVDRHHRRFELRRIDLSCPVGPFQGFPRPAPGEGPGTASSWPG